MKSALTVVLLLMIASAATAVAQNAPAKDLFVSKCAICHGADGSAKTTWERTSKFETFIPPTSKANRTRI